MSEITVVVPVYNGADTLESCVYSILNQDLPAAIILFNDGSTDSTLDIIKKLSHSSDNVRYVTREQRSGSADYGIGECIKLCNTEFFSWIGCDDLYESSALSKMIKALKHNPSADYAYCDFQTFGDLSLAPRGYGRFKPCTKKSYLQHFHNTLLTQIPWNGVWRSSYLQSSEDPWKIYDGVGNRSDTINGLYHMSRGAETIHLNEPLIHYNLRPSSGTHDIRGRVLTLPHKLKHYYKLVDIPSLLDLHNCEEYELISYAEKHCEFHIQKYITNVQFSEISARDHYELTVFLKKLSPRELVEDTGLHRRIENV